jgi:hypothetical protein
VEAGYVIERVRKTLNEVDTNTYSDEYIVNIVNEVQDSIFRKIKPDFQFTIDLDGSEFYYFPNPSVFQLDGIITSWKGEIIFVPPSRWNEIQSIQSGQFPSFAMVFEGKIYLYPVSSSGSITFFGKQIGLMTKMEKDTFTTVPAQYDKALIYGTLAEFNAQYLPLFEQILEKTYIESAPSVGSNILHPTYSF